MVTQAEFDKMLPTSLNNGAAAFKNGYDAQVADRDAKLAALIKGQQIDQEAGIKANQIGQEADLKDRNTGKEYGYKGDLYKSQQDTDLAGQDAQIKKAIALSQGLKGFGVGLGKDSVTLTPHSQTPAGAASEERNKIRLINQIKNDYDKQVGSSPKRVQAAQSILNALDSGDITTIGRIKAQLPTLEGENYKPTDAERELILSPTGEGKLAKLKNWWGGDQAAVSASQTDALRKLAQKRLEEETGFTNRAQNEVMKRYANNVKSLTPDQLSDLGDTLGMGSKQLIDSLNSRFAGYQPSTIGGNLKKIVTGTGGDKTTVAPPGGTVNAGLKQQPPGSANAAAVPQGLSPAEQAELEALRGQYGTK